MMKEVYESVKECIKVLENEKEKYVQNPNRDFTRLRKISFSDCIMSVCCMSGGTLFSELLEFYQDSSDPPSVSALLQQRSKLKHDAFEAFFRLTVSLNHNRQVYQGYRLFAVDGSDVQIPCNPDDENTFFPGTNGQKPYNLVHLNAMYDILSNTYQDIIIQDRMNWAEQEALNQMVDGSDVENALVIADRGYESYNVMAHIQEKGWKYLLRVKDIGGNGIVSRLELPQEPCFDVDVDLQITRKFSNETKQLFLDKNHYRYAPPNSKLDYLPPHSKYKEDAFDPQLWKKTNMPNAVVEVVDPIALGAKVVDIHDKCCQCDDDFDLASVPESVCRVFDDSLILGGEQKRVFVSIGIFSIVKLERKVQLLIPAYDFCIPEKECIGATDDNPCELFDRISFPVDEFFPPEKCEFIEDKNCGC